MKSFLKPDPKFRNGYKDPKRMAAIHDLYCVVCFAKGLKQTTKTIAHHSIGGGLGLKVSDLKTCAICEFHHNKGGNGDAIHNTPLWEWEEKFFTQNELILMTNRMLENEK
jgi:hypothetical protein